MPHHPSTADRLDVSSLGFTRRAWVAATPEDCYRLISDVALVGQWSPTASEVTYDEGAGPRAGAWFSGQNRRGDRTWATRSQVGEAVPGESFAFTVGGLEDGIVDWRWTFVPSGDGCEVRQGWSLRRYDPVLGATQSELEELAAFMADSVESTLVALARWCAGARGAGDLEAATCRGTCIPRSSL